MERKITIMEKNQIKRLIALVVLFAFCFTQAGFAQELIVNKPQRSGINLAPPLTLDDIGPETQHVKYLTIARMELAMELDKLDQMRDIDGTTDWQAIKDAVAKLNNAARDHDKGYRPTSVTPFFNQVEPADPKRPSHIFTVPVKVQKDGRIYNYRLLFSTIRAEGEQFKSVLCTEEYLNRVRAEIVRQDILPEWKTEDLKAGETYGQQEQGIDKLLEWCHNPKNFVVKVDYSREYTGIVKGMTERADTNIDVVNPLNLMPIEDRPCTIILINPEVERRLKECGIELQAQDGTRQTVISYCHSSNGAVNKFVYPDQYSKWNSDNIQVKAAEVRQVMRDIGHEIGVMLGLPILKFEKIGEEFFPINEIDQRLNDPKARVTHKTFAIADLDTNLSTRDHATSLTRAAEAKVKILFADNPQDLKTLDVMRKDLSTEFGSAVEIIAESGMGSNEKLLWDAIEKYNPDIIVVRSATTGFQRTKDHDPTLLFRLAKEHGVKLIIRAGAGYENIGDEEAAKHGISVGRTHGNANSVADLTLFLLASLTRGNAMVHHVPAELKQLVQTPPDEYPGLIRKSKKWGDITDAERDEIISRWQSTIFEPLKDGEMEILVATLQGKTIGLLGWGQVAQTVAQKLDQIRKITGVKLDIVAYSRSLKADNEAAVKFNVKPVSRPELFRQSNFVSIHIKGIAELALTEQELNSQKLEAVFNTSRSVLVDPKLVEQFAIKRKKYFGDLDMTAKLKDLMKKYPDNVVIFPHIGASTKDAAAGIEERTIPSLIEMCGILLGRQSDSEESVLEIVNGVTPVPIKVTVPEDKQPRRPDGTFGEKPRMNPEVTWEVIIRSPAIQKALNNEPGGYFTIVDCETGFKEVFPTEEVPSRTTIRNDLASLIGGGKHIGYLYSTKRGLTGRHVKIRYLLTPKGEDEMKRVQSERVSQTSSAASDRQILAAARAILEEPAEKFVDNVLEFDALLEGVKDGARLDRLEEALSGDLTLPDEPIEVGRILPVGTVKGCFNDRRHALTGVVVQEQLKSSHTKPGKSGRGTAVTNSGAIIGEHRGVYSINKKIFEWIVSGARVVWLKQKGFTQKEIDNYRNSTDRNFEPTIKFDYRKLSDGEVCLTKGGRKLWVVRLPADYLTSWYNNKTGSTLMATAHLGLREGVVWVADKQYDSRKLFEPGENVRDAQKIEMDIRHEIEEYNIVWEDTQNEASPRHKWTMEQMAVWRDKASPDAQAFFQKAHVKAWRRVSYYSEKNSEIASRARQLYLDAINQYTDEVHNVKPGRGIAITSAQSDSTKPVGDIFAALNIGIGGIKPNNNADPAIAYLSGFLKEVGSQGGTIGYIEVHASERELNRNSLPRIMEEPEHYGTRIGTISPEIWDENVYVDSEKRALDGEGALSSRNTVRREKAIGMVKDAIDLAVDAHCPKVNLWLGLDMVERENREARFTILVDSVRACLEYAAQKGIMLTFESVPLNKAPKGREPIFYHMRQLIELKDALREAGVSDENLRFLGGIFDIAHEIWSNLGDEGWVNPESPDLAGAAKAVLDAGIKLYIHANDANIAANRTTDVGVEHPSETQALFSLLAERGCESISLDLAPETSDIKEAARRYLRNFKKLQELTREQDSGSVARRGSGEAIPNAPAPKGSEITKAKEEIRSLLKRGDYDVVIDRLRQSHAILAAIAGGIYGEGEEVEHRAMREDAILSAMCQVINSENGLGFRESARAREIGQELFDRLRGYGVDIPWKEPGAAAKQVKGARRSRPRSPGKSPEDAMVIIGNYLLDKEKFSARDYLELYRTHWKAYGFKEAVKDDEHALETVREDLHRNERLLVKQGSLEILPETGPNGEFLYKFTAIGREVIYLGSVAYNKNEEDISARVAACSVLLDSGFETERLTDYLKYMTSDEVRPELRVMAISALLRHSKDKVAQYLPVLQGIAKPGIIQKVAVAIAMLDAGHDLNMQIGFLHETIDNEKIIDVRLRIDAAAALVSRGLGRPEDIKFLTDSSKNDEFYKPSRAKACAALHVNGDTSHAAFLQEVAFDKGMMHNVRVAASEALLHHMVKETAMKLIEMPEALARAYNIEKVRRAGHVIGVPKEIKPQAERVGLTPIGVRFLVDHGVKVIVEKGAGREHFSDEAYRAAGAELADTAKEVWDRATIIKKVKEPLESEYQYLRPGQIVFTFLHLASPELAGLAREMVAKRVTGIAYETISKVESGRKVTPVLRPVSVIAGDLGGYYAIPYLLEAPVGADKEVQLTADGQNMMGNIKSGYPDRVDFEGKLSGKEAVVLGGGVSGERMALRLLESGAKVTVTDINENRLAELRKIFEKFGDKFTAINPGSDINNPQAPELMERYVSADILGGCILLPGGRAPQMNRELLEQISKLKQKIIVDVALDQGGNFYGSYSREYDDPVFVDKFGNKRFCVPNMPDAVGRVASSELEKTSIAYTLALAMGKDVSDSFKILPELREGMNICDGKIVHPEVADANPDLPRGEVIWALESHQVWDGEPQDDRDTVVSDDWEAPAETAAPSPATAAESAPVPASQTQTVAVEPVNLSTTESAATEAALQTKELSLLEQADRLMPPEYDDNGIGTDISVLEKFLSEKLGRPIQLDSDCGNIFSEAVAFGEKVKTEDGKEVFNPGIIRLLPMLAKVGIKIAVVVASGNNAAEIAIIKGYNKKLPLEKHIKYGTNAELAMSELKVARFFYYKLENESAAPAGVNISIISVTAEQIIRILGAIRQITDEAVIRMMSKVGQLIAQAA